MTTPKSSPKRMQCYDQFIKSEHDASFLAETSFDNKPVKPYASLYPNIVDKLNILINIFKYNEDNALMQTSMLRVIGSRCGKI